MNGWLKGGDSGFVDAKYEYEFRGCQVTIPSGVYCFFLPISVIVKVWLHCWWFIEKIVGVFFVHEPAFFAAERMNAKFSIFWMKFARKGQINRQQGTAYFDDSNVIQGITLSCCAKKAKVRKLRICISPPFIIASSSRTTRHIAFRHWCNNQSQKSLFRPHFRGKLLFPSQSVITIFRTRDFPSKIHLEPRCSLN